MRDFTNLNGIDKPIGQMSDEPWKFFVNTDDDDDDDDIILLSYW